MQRLVLFLFALLVLSSCSRTQADSKRIFIAINPVDCVSCIKNMESLFKNSSIPPVTFVFEEKYRKDSSAIIQSMSLKEYGTVYAWSDSLFDLYSAYGISALSLVSSNGTILFNKPLKALTQEDVRMLQGDKKPVSDTFELPREVAQHAYEEMLTDGNRFYFCDVRKMKIDVVGLRDLKYQKTLSVEQQDVKAAFDLALGKGAYGSNKRALNSLHVPNQEVLQYYALSDSGLIAVAAYTCIAAINGTDTAVAGFYAVHKFGDGTTTTVFPDLPFLRKTFFQDKGNLISCEPAAYYYNGAYFAAIRKSDTAKSLSGKRFLAKLLPDHGRLRYQELFDYRMPDVYTNGNNAFPVFDGAYCMLPLANRIYSLSGKEVLELNGLTFKVSQDFFTPPDKYIVAFKVQNDNVTLIYHVQEKRQYHLFRYDLKKGQILFDKIIPSGRNKPVVDWNDNNYVYYRLGDHLLIRQHHANF
ncbi:hypothetical protein B0I18_11516 [Taibaiella chishuiensis]|uniref:TolB-like protein n=2 Tax=Taibaiella chishuiensis TaxID=1434707 RepID=A0A2P8CT43_9BACT|nr:hypothetical protein B0I18_11516 [Taibaiella chishuiensis]